MKNRKILLVFGAFLLAVALSIIVRTLDSRKIRGRQDSQGVDSGSDGQVSPGEYRQCYSVSP